MTSLAAANGPHVLRRMNRAAVLQAVRAGARPVSVASLIDSTGLSRPAVTRALADLVDAAVVERLGVTEPPQGHIGRPAQRVRFRSERGFVAGLDIGPRRVHVILADLLGDPIRELTVHAAPAASDVAQAAASAIEECARSAGLDLTKLWAIGAGTPGIVDTGTGDIRVAPSIPGWAGLPVAQTLSERYRCPVRIDNDMNLAALAEQSRGAATGCVTFAYVHWDERVGTGIVFDGEPYRGASSAAGELGFIDLVGDLDRAPDRPGNAAVDGAGSFERLVGTTAIRDLALQMSTTDDAHDLYDKVHATSPHDIAPVLFGRAADGDETAAAICDRITARFSAGLAVFLMLIDPGVVVLGGRVAQAGEPLVTAVQRNLRTRLLSTPTLLLSPLREEAVALGAVQYALADTEVRLANLGTD